MTASVSPAMTKQDIIEYLKNVQISTTTQRVEMAHLLLSKLQHISAEEVYNLVNKEYSKASRATVYNNLHLFERAGLIKSLNISPVLTVYDTNTTPHFHFVDTETGRIRDIACNTQTMNKILETALECKDLEQSNAQVAGLQLIFYGKE